MMPFHAPILRLANKMPPQMRFEEKFGGLPWGLPPERWPSCSACGKPLSLLAQLAHDAARLDLGQAGRVLFVFQCNHDPGMCESWSATSGANACLVLEESELAHGLTPLPSTAIVVEEEARVVGWRAGDDAEKEPEMITKLGGIPSWIQGEDEGPAMPWRWVAQFDSQHQLEDGSRCEAANYGDAGIAYVYVNTAESKPVALMFWQCC
jgi:uncharacterized protein YwqG